MNATMTIAIYQGARLPWTGPIDGLLTVTNDREINRRLSITKPAFDLEVPFHDGPGDAYRMVLAVPGYHDSGAFLHADETKHLTKSFLLIPKHARPQFPGWAQLQDTAPAAARLISAGVDAATAASRYASLAEQQPLALASLMNLAAAMRRLVIGGQKTPLDLIHEVIWDSTLAQDRFFAWTDPAILPLIRAAAVEGQFAEEPHPGLLHPGATCSYKQKQFDYANVQLTFHENDTHTIGELKYIKLEPDMDLYRELVAHGLGELIPNLFTNGRTNPLAVLALRWLAAVQSDEPLFDPGYTCV